jgi:hypothetical protein
MERIDPTISIDDEEDGSAFFDVVTALVDISEEARDALLSLSYSEAAAVYRCVRAA